jgi:hypothetical protein
VITTDEQLVRATRLRLWRDHLALLPHLSRRTRRFLGPLNGLLVDG